MVFSELYSAYYNTVASIISEIQKGEKSQKELQKIVVKKAFGESVLTIIPSLKSGKWQIVTPDFSTPITHKPTMPLTLLQKMWLKAISLDKRIQLFGVEFPSLSDIEPLFTPDDYYVYDKYSDGDDFENENYIKNFKTILEAIRNKTQIKFEMTDRNGNTVFARCRPLGLEYSEKDDKFRVITAGKRYVSTVNLSKIKFCTIYTGNKPCSFKPKETQFDTATVKITDERNALERFMLHFAHFEKQAEKLGKNTYLIKFKYDVKDDAEIAIRLLSFGPRIEVIESESLRGLIIEKLKKQKNCLL